MSKRDLVASPCHLLPAGACSETLETMIYQDLTQEALKMIMVELFLG